MDSDIVPNRTRGPGFPWASESQEPTQFEERHLIFIKQLGKVSSSHAADGDGRGGLFLTRRR